MTSENHPLSKINFEINFADEEIEKAYQQHVKEMLEELPEYCRNAKKMTRIIKKVDGKEHITYTPNITKRCFGLLQILIAFVAFPFIYLLYRKGIFDRHWKKVTIKKLVSNANREVEL